MKKILGILKQEVVFIPLMLIALELCRNILHAIWPETAFFDRGSELETYLTAILKTVLGTTAVWIIMRVVFPNVYKSLQEFYTGFALMADETKRKYSIAIFFCFFFGMVYLMKANTPEGNIRIKLVDTLHTQMNVREATGHNDGVAVESYLHFVDAKKGQAWCAAFCCTNLNAVGVTPPTNPKTAWAPVFANERYIVWSPGLEKQHKVKMQPAPGDCFTVAYAGTNTVEHVGFITGQTDGYFITIEGNTGRGLDQGVHSYKRDKHKIFAVTNYITPYLKTHEKTNSNFRIGVTTMPGLHAENYTEHTRYNGHGNENNCSAGLHYNTRHDLCFQRRQLENNCNYNCRQKRSGEYAGNKNGNATIGNRRINYQWAFASRLYLQGFGGKMPIARASNKRTTNPYRKEERYDCKGSFSKIYTGLA
jgi:hypothetical protein